MKPSEPTKDFLKQGPLASLPWTKVTRRSTAAPGTTPQSDVAYGVRSSDDIVRGLGSKDTFIKR